MFGFGLTFAATILLAYIVWRLSSVPWFSRDIPKKWFLYGGLLAWIILAGGRSLEHDVGSTWASTAGLISITLTFVLFLVFVCLVPVELATGFGHFCPRLAPRLRGWAMLGGCALAAVATIKGLRPPVLTEYDVRMKGLPKALNGKTLVALSDLHLGTTLGPRWLEARVAQIQALKPDLIVQLGDTFEGHGENTEAFLPAFSKLAAPLGVWAVDGNHENHGAIRSAAAFLDGTQIPTLQNELTQVAPGLVLAGRRVLREHEAGTATAPWNPSGIRPPGNLILLSHIPEDSQGAARAGVALMLSGHTHGGQVWPFSLLVAMKQPEIEGRYVVEGMTLLVCRGTGTWGPRMRLWKPSEILHITLWTN
jgi:predicted MPP superfamily phosphohydrolase